MKKIAIIGAGMAGITCARTLAQAGHSVQVFEKSRGLAGRMATRRTPFGSFDHGTPYFVARDPRFILALKTVSSGVQPWARGHEKGHALVATPGMSALVNAWAAPLVHDLSGQHSVQTEVLIQTIERDVVNPRQWQLRAQVQTDSQHVFSGFDAVILAIPSVQAQALLQASNLAQLAKPLNRVTVAPGWSLMLAFSYVVDHAQTFGPDWNAKKVDHPRISWLARESSKPVREATERWTVQANAKWSQEHLEDDADTVRDKLLRAFSETTGIHTEPNFSQVHRWRYSRTVKALGQSFVWHHQQSIGMCGDWCLGHRVEDAFISGLEMALAVV
jgi:renalase